MASAEIDSLVAVTVLTGMVWVPYVLNRITVGKGPWHEMGYPQTATVLSPWAERVKRAHENAVENLVVFAPLVLAVEVTGAHSSLTVAAAWAYVAARVAHLVSFSAGIPVVRTLAFTLGWMCQLALGYAVLSGGS